MISKQSLKEKKVLKLWNENKENIEKETSNVLDSLQVQQREPEYEGAGNQEKEECPCFGTALTGTNVWSFNLIKLLRLVVLFMHSKLARLDVSQDVPEFQ